jgi:hypothetical protein
MEIPFLTSLMGTLTVIATYYWVVRSEIAPPKSFAWDTGLAPLNMSPPPYWSNEWI